MTPFIYIYTISLSTGFDEMEATFILKFTLDFHKGHFGCMHY